MAAARSPGSRRIHDSRGARLAVALAAGLLVAGCERPRGLQATVPPPPGPADDMGRLPLGAPPGQTVNAATKIANPLEGDPAAAQEGKALFGAMNCVYCHGANGSGLIGPALDAPGWRYGGTPAELFNSIHDGRPKGMPAWGAALPPREIWKLVAYLESLGGASAPAAAAAVEASASTTGPQPNGQAKADTAQQGLARADAAARP
jgi:cytochrome c oxidase cbb3-type subunit III